MANLGDCFTRAFQPDDAKEEGSKVLPQIIFAWLYRIEDSLLTALQERRPLALIIYAHYLVLLGQLREK